MVQVGCDKNVGVRFPRPFGQGDPAQIYKPMDLSLLFSTRIIRLFCYGFLSGVVALYLGDTGLIEVQSGLLFTLTLIGDAVITLWLTTSADKFGRKRTLLFGALLMTGAGIAFVMTQNYILLILAAILGVISPADKDIGPFLSVEQASLTHLISNEKRTQIFAWYNLAGSFASAMGALVGGWLAQNLIDVGHPRLFAYVVIIAGYAVGGVILFVLFLNLSPHIEVTKQTDQIKRVLGLHRSRNMVFKLSSLFALDAFAGGLLVQSFLAYWFHVKFGVETGILGSIFFGANILAGVSALLAVRIARKFGLINTMVFTHIPSSILLMLIPWMPTLWLAVVLLLLRFSISQMDVPTRQSYTMAVVAPDERSAAAGVTAIARSVGSAVSPALTGLFFSIPALFNLPFFLCGGLKIIYDLLLFREFRAVTPPEEIM